MGGTCVKREVDVSICKSEGAIGALSGEAARSSKFKAEGIVRTCFEATQSHESGKVPLAFTYIAAAWFRAPKGP